MNEPLNSYWRGVRERARAEAFAAERLKIERRRRAEKQLRKRGLGGPFDDLVMSDVERLKRSGEYEVLSENEQFRERVATLEAELAGALEEVKEREDLAVLSAMVEVPPELELLDRHQRERNLMLMQAGVEDVSEALPSVQEGFNELVRKQQQELEAVRK